MKACHISLNDNVVIKNSYYRDLQPVTLISGYNFLNWMSSSEMIAVVLVFLHCGYDVCGQRPGNYFHNEDLWIGIFTQGSRKM